MAKLHVFRGLPGSGKSTAAIKLIQEHGANDIVRVNRDLLRLMLHGGNMQHTAEASEYEMEVTIMQRKLIKARLEANKDVISDDTNLHPAAIRGWRTMASNFRDVEVVLHDECLAVPLDECLRRNRGRAEYVPEEVIRRMYSQAVKGGLING